MIIAGRRRDEYKQTAPYYITIIKSLIPVLSESQVKKE